MQKPLEAPQNVLSAGVASLHHRGLYCELAGGARGCLITGVAYLTITLEVARGCLITGGSRYWDTDAIGALTLLGHWTYWALTLLVGNSHY